MPDFEQVCRRLFWDSSWFIKCLLGALLISIPVVHFVAFGYLARVASVGARGQEFSLPEWDDWRLLLVRGLAFFLIFLVLAGGLFLLAALLSTPFGWLGFLAYVPFIPAMLLAWPLAAAGWYRYHLTGQVTEAFRLGELFRILREAWPRLLLPTFAFLGFLLAGAPVFPLAFFVGGIVVFYFYCATFHQVESRRLSETNTHFSVL